MTVFDPAAFSIQPNARRLEKPWGYEVLLSPADAPYTAKLIHVRAGKRLSLQLHDTKVETQTLVAGRGLLVLEGSDGELHEIEMEPGLGYHVAVKPTGILAPVPELQALVGLVGHPTDALDLYVYGGLEQAGQTSFTVNGTLLHVQDLVLDADHAAALATLVPCAPIDLTPIETFTS